MSDRSIDRVVELLTGSTSILAFTGAGVSTESGIPDFRSPGGVWSRHQPVYYDEFIASADARRRYWRLKAECQTLFRDAKPNVTHQILAKWEQAGILRGIITQNIDGLHQDSGSENVLELHGTDRWIRCLSCFAEYEPLAMVELFESTGDPPDCPKCSGLLKHATISFGQALSPSVIQEAARWSKECDLFLAMGSSLVVTPAAQLPLIAVEHKAALVILNRDPTPLDQWAEVVIRGPLGETIEEIERRRAAKR